MDFPVIKFLIALAIGALMGIERERKIKRTEFAGIRTFMLISLMGALSANLSGAFPLVFPAALLGLIILILASYIVTTWDEGDVGLTGEVAAIIAFLLGALCFSYDYRLAVILAIIVTAILALKRYIHVFVRKISEREMIDTLKFLMIAFVVLPLLPDAPMGPWGVFNPSRIWLMVVFISGISYAGYIAMKVIGPGRGLGATGVIGGLVSSTAVVTAMAGRVRESEFLMGPAVFAAVVASSMMFLRMLFEVAVINPSLLGFIAPPMIVMGGLGFLLGFLFTRTPSDMESDIKIENPFSIKPALIFGALFMGILFISKAASIYLGRSGLLIAAMVSGVADVDAITVSLSVLAGAGSISSGTAAAAITIAGISNTLVKTGIAFLLGTKKFGKRVGMVFLAVIAAGVLTVFLTVL
ncbi:MgtC/SapB family protein [Methanothermobacter wolfeii]|uniref:MgtC/SapB family protein n=1 Tax=Methanothermobacter wolfeii TaxID=145261 RepID=UPI0024B355E1|nr:MgtC/SapB family protein [Methanothermobacter wolfeii]MDI6701752.1 MgtC/SapB family protein [Methanothermobacter wolfeii]